MNRPPAGARLPIGANGSRWWVLGTTVPVAALAVFWFWDAGFLDLLR